MPTDAETQIQVRKWDEDCSADLYAARESLRKIAQAIGPSRELSLAITNIEQAMLWQAAARSTIGAIVELTTPHAHDADHMAADGADGRDGHAS